MVMGTHWRFYIYKYLSRSCADIVTSTFTGSRGGKGRGGTDPPLKDQNAIKKKAKFNLKISLTTSALNVNKLK